MRYILSVCIIFLLVAGFRSPVLVEDTVIKMVSSKKDPLLKKYEKLDRIFIRIENKKLNIISYFHRRMIGEAIVEKDFIRYQFDAKTGKLIEKTENWREGLPEKISPLYTREQAVSKVEGRVMTSKLYFISPKSQVFCIEPVPENPCWIVWSKEGGRVIITIIDSMTGKILGYGVPPPYQGFAFHCGVVDGWKKWRDNADKWFEEKMGYTTKRSTCPCDNSVQSWIQSDDIALFYELSHGGSDSVHQGCSECSTLTASEVETWIDKYASMAFTFLASCNGMCNQTDGNLSFEFRKGSDVDAVTVGYCGMSDNPCASDCWPDSLDWQDDFFSFMNDGWPVGYAFDRANLAFPNCANCMRIAGDRLLVFAGRGVLKVKRSISGELYDIEFGNFRFSPLPGMPARQGYRAYYVRSDIYVPPSRCLTLLPGTTRPIIDLFFMNNSKINCFGLLNADGRRGEILLVSAEDNSKGIKIIGELRVKSGGQIKIYE